MTILDILALLLSLAALFGFINYQLLRLPPTIGLVIIALLASGGVILIDFHWPQFGIGDTARGFLRDIDFQDVLMEGFLSALLFVGAVHVDISQLRGNRFVVGLLATVGVLISTFFVGGAMWLTARLLDFQLPFIWALVFGALISPTDPVAVLGMLKTVRVPPSLESKIAGESLFNDGVAVVVFTIVVAFATGSGHASADIGAWEVVLLFLGEAFGGAALGLVCGLTAFVLMRSIDEHNLEVLITLALVAGTYAAALHLHISGPIAVVVAGLLIGNHGREFAMSENTRSHVFQFWDLTDEILNAVLFLLIGLEVLVIGFDKPHAMFVLLAIPIVLVARWTAVATSIGLLRVRRAFTRGAIRILTWGGLRGGISVALALSLPFSEFKQPILSATYVVVIFSIIVQGLTMRLLVRRLIAQEEAADLHEGEPLGPAPAHEPHDVGLTERLKPEAGAEDEASEEEPQEEAPEEPQQPEKRAEPSEDVAISEEAAEAPEQEEEKKDEVAKDDASEEGKSDAEDGEGKGEEEAKDDKKKGKRK